MADPVDGIPLPGTNPRDERVESLMLRLLRDMRAEHSASMQAMIAEAANTRRSYANMERIFDRLDGIASDLTAFRAETGKSLRRLESDMIAAEGQNIQRQADIVEAVNRIADVERVLRRHNETGSG